MCLPKDFFVIYSHKIGINIHKRTQFKFYGENTTSLILCILLVCIVVIKTSVYLDNTYFLAKLR